MDVYFCESIGSYVANLLSSHLGIIFYNFYINIKTYMCVYSMLRTIGLLRAAKSGLFYQCDELPGPNECVLLRIGFRLQTRSQLHQTALQYSAVNLRTSPRRSHKITSCYVRLDHFAALWKLVASRSVTRSQVHKTSSENGLLQRSVRYWIETSPRGTDDILTRQRILLWSMHVW